MGQFYGEYDLTLDDKNRLLVPSEIRRSMDAQVDGEAFFLITGGNRKLWLFADKFYRTLAPPSTPEVAPTREALDFEHAYFAMASHLEWDKQGRILIPERTLKKANLQREVTLIGSRDHLELWNRQDWDVRREDLIRSGPEVALRARVAELAAAAAAAAARPALGAT